MSDPPISKTRTWAGRLGAGIVGVALLYMAVRRSIGPLSVAGLLAGGWLAALAWAPVSAKLRSTGVKLTVLAVAVYAMLLPAELFITRGERTDTRIVAESTRYMNSPDAALGYRLTPGWTGTYRDSVVEVGIEINRLGHRDADPEGDVIADDVLLLGDSFVFGQGLALEDTIQAAIERESEGAVSAYSAGAPGWGSPQALHMLQNLPWKGRTAIYLVCINDSTFDNAYPDAYGVSDGYTVTRKYPDGRELSQAEIDKRIARHVEHTKWGEWKNRIQARLTLLGLRSLVRAMGDRDLMMIGAPSHVFKDEYRQRVVEDTLAMQARAKELGAALHVVMIAAMGEVQRGEWAPATEAMIGAFEAADITVHADLLTRVEMEGFLLHDGHFAAGGATETARYILELAAEDFAPGTGASG